MRKILIVYTGGTFGMSANLTFEKLNSAKLKKNLFDQVPELKKIAQCTVEVLFQIDSCQFDVAHWLKLARYLRTQERHYDGVVILHGTDTLAYSAAALSYLLSPTRIPIVITGAQKPLATLRNDARTNLISTIEVAARAPKALRNRVMVAFHDELFLGTRVRKKSAVDFSAFESPRFPKLATIGSEIKYHDVVKHMPRLRTGKRPIDTMTTSMEYMDPKILRTEVTPIFPEELFTTETLASLDAILLTLYTSGTAPTQHMGFRTFLKRAREKHTPIFAITEREDAALKLDAYESGKEMKAAGVIWCGDLTPEAATVKIWFTRMMQFRLAPAQYHAWLKKNWSRAISDEA
ncbi:MAG: asparaginase [Bdellovibrionales bacterium]|nr:asparaginase [Bdellovibrionales bacterium]